MSISAASSSYSRSIGSTRCSCTYAFSPSDSDRCTPRNSTFMASPPALKMGSPAPAGEWGSPASLLSVRAGGKGHARRGRFGTARGLLRRMGTGTDRIRVLLIEDDGDSRELLAEILEEAFEVRTAKDGLAGLAAFEADHPDV